MKEWVRDHLDWFLQRGYKIVACNNAWKLVPLHQIDAWHTSSNFMNRTGTFVPTKAERAQMKQVIIHNQLEAYLYQTIGYPHYTDYYKDYKGGTMFLNIVYDYLMNYPSPFEMVVVGFDMVYRKDGDTFYADTLRSKARNDPLLKWGRDGLNAELQNSWEHFKKRDTPIFNGSLQTETSLPYPRFIKK